eukprot:c18397_g1_i1.p3 GENE.c18397_g1_i1~~c18397_g1_i1.p3  ORF type:complete len:112 (-),score=1.63 c18397_g1_i1:2268-2603(-)
MSIGRGERSTKTKPNLLRMIVMCAKESGLSTVAPIHLSLGVNSVNQEKGVIMTSNPSLLSRRGSAFKHNIGSGTRQIRFAINIISNLPNDKSILQASPTKNLTFSLAVSEA